MATITLCLIARDEARFLPDCLASVKGVADEIIVADTGSQDDTVALAKAAGAKVVHHTWTDDFAAARNAALAPATGDWILLLDADERLVPGVAEIIRAAIQADTFDCASLPLYDAQTLAVKPEQLESHRAQFKDPVYLKRLFRRTSDLCWEGAIHESVPTWLKGRIQGRVEAPIVHYGNVPQLREERGKSQRNYKLLAKKAKKRPGDLKTQAYFLAESFRHKRDEETRQLARQTWLKLRKAPLEHKLRLIPVVTIYLNFLIDTGELDQAKVVIHEASAWGETHPHLFWMRGICEENRAAKSEGQAQRDHLTASAEAYAQCVRCQGRSFQSEVTWGITSWMSLVALGRVQMRLGAVKEARSAYEEAAQALKAIDLQQEEVLAHRQQALLGAIHAQILDGDVKLAMRGLRKNKDLPAADLSLLRAEAYERSNNFESCLRLIGELVQQEVSFTYVAAHHIFRELLCLVNLFKGTYMAGEGAIGTLSAVLLDRDLKEIRQPVFLDENRLQRAIRFVISCRGATPFGRFYDAAVQTQLPELCQLVRSAVDDS